MLKKRKLAYFVFLTSLFKSRAVLAANLRDAFGSKIKDFAEGAGFDITSQTDPVVIVAQVVQAFLSFLGIIFLILIIYAGFRYMTAQGNEQQAEAALTTIKHAIVGLIIVLASYGISYFLVSLFSEQTLNFSFYAFFIS